MQYWLMKSEPDTFGIDDLKARGTAAWDGVRNYQARNMMRDQMSVGDRVFFYHSSCAVPGIAGLMRVASAPHPDPSAWDPESKYFDPKSSPDTPRWCMLDVAFERHLERLIPLAELRANPALGDMPLLQKGNRLSIMPVSEAEFEAILQME